VKKGKLKKHNHKKNHREALPAGMLFSTVFQSGLPAVSQELTAQHETLPERNKT
jgi:hypothetical protein